jgi:beta-lactamase regulating signal transducer with metallopeptidase domain
MADTLIQLTLNNLVISAALALVAYGLHRHGRYPGLAHGLWVLVLLKLITPPLMRLPIIPTAVAGQPPAAAASDAVASVISVGPVPLLAPLAEHGLTLLLIAWAVGSLLVFTTSVVRIARFDRLIRRTSSVAPGEVLAIAAGAARELGLRTAPTIYTSSAHLSPMTWWTGGKVRVVIPQALPLQVGPDQLRLVLAHELAHVKRRDHLVRWLEWLTVVAFWWNPIVWFARRTLRLDEEVSCDALVLERLGAEPRPYARALLDVVEFLAGHTTRTPAVASAIDAGGSLERRLLTIITDGRTRRAPRWLAAGVISVALMLMTFGVGYAGIEAPAEVTREEPASQAVVPTVPGASDTAEIPDPAAAIEPAQVPEPQLEQFALLSASGSVPSPAGQRPWNRVFRGTPGSDTYAGSRGRDKVIGRGGADDLAGRAKRDLIRGGRGSDIIRGGGGADQLFGGPGDDTISGGRGRDVIFAGNGNDDIHAGPGNDVIKSWQDGMADKVDCGAGTGDRAIVDSLDTLVNCEIVVVRDPA